MEFKIDDYPELRELVIDSTKALVTEIMTQAMMTSRHITNASEHLVDTTEIVGDMVVNEVLMGVRNYRSNAEPVDEDSQAPSLAKTGHAPASSSSN